MALWSTFLNKAFLSLHGRRLGLFSGITGARVDDSVLAGDGFHGCLFSTADSITAHAGGGQAGAVNLTAFINRVTTVATAADSVALPPSQPGMMVTVINDAALNSMQVFGNYAEAATIDGVATGTGNALAAAHRGVYVCVTAGKWESYGGAKAS